MSPPMPRMTPLSPATGSPALRLKSAPRTMAAGRPLSQPLHLPQGHHHRRSCFCLTPALTGSATRPLGIIDLPISAGFEGFSGIFAQFHSPCRKSSTKFHLLSHDSVFPRHSCWRQGGALSCNPVGESVVRPTKNIMAVNLADMQTVGVVLGSPIVAGAVAVHRQTGWFIPVFDIGGLAVGAGLGYLIHFVAYRMIPTTSASSRWREGMAGLAYLLGPLIFSTGGLAFVVWASERFADQIHYSSSTHIEHSGESKPPTGPTTAGASTFHP